MDGLRERANGIAAEHGFDPKYYVVVDEAKDTPYKVVDVTSGADPLLSIRLRFGDETAALEACSGLTRQLQREAYHIVRLCTPEVVRDELNT